MAQRNELSFVVFLINALSDAWGKATSDVYSLLKSSGALDQYVIPYYDVLHTCGSAYLVEDITDYLSRRGIKP